jgi:hypothetical protein
MTRNDKITLIIEHMINYEIEDTDQFVEFLHSLLKYDDDELNKQLEILENLI